ncbi:MAG: sigma-54 dependent transcriptional regulator [Alphaproteobacteria bacterium]
MAHDILIVDDETDIRMQISGILEDEGYQTREASNSAEALAAVSSRQPSLLILDVWLANSEYDGLQILEIVHRDHPGLPVVMISGHGTFDMAVSATKKGAYDFISKPFKTDVLLLTIERALNEARLRHENASLRQLSPFAVLDELVGKSWAINEVRRSIDKVAGTDSRVLISGPPGAGKGAVARVLHSRSHRKDGRFVTLTCASLSVDTLEGALFGIEAHDGKPRRIGVLEEAHGGTLLLDEVADMDLATQFKIVRVLHSKRFQRVGGETWVEVNARVLATTSQDLQALIADGKFREDLFYRLNVVPLTVPALVDRREDIPLLANHFMERSAAAKGRQPRRLGPDGVTALQGYDWPGNVWELANVIERLLLLAPGDPGEPLRADAVQQAIGSADDTGSRWDRTPEVMGLPLREAREAFEREYLVFHLARFGGNISRTAEFVGMDRAALHRKLKGLGVGTSFRPKDGNAEKSENTVSS